MAKQGSAKRLGRGLSSLIAEPVKIETPTNKSTQRTDNKYLTADQTGPGADQDGLMRIPTHDIIPNINQPRKTFDVDSLESLGASIRVAGVIQPIVVRRIGAGQQGGNAAHDGARWELIAGERRWRAAKLVGLETVPAVVRDVTDRVAAEWALVENLQREDLNPVERARALAHLRDEFGLTQSQVAEQVGLDRATVANLMRLIELEDDILDMLVDGTLTAGHGKALLSVAVGPARLSLATRAAKENWSVRRLEREANSAATVAPARAAGTERAKTAHVAQLEKDLGDHLGAKLSIKQSPNNPSGVITIHYFDLDHFESVLEKLRFRNSGADR